MTTTYLRGLSIDEPFVRQSTTGDEYYLTDALGSTLALTDGTGNVTATYSYDPFGNTTVTGTSTNVFQYTGRENDDTGLYYYRFRYYAPRLQRFISEDPILAPFTPMSVGFGRTAKTKWLLPMKIESANPEISGLLNGFVYAMNNPVLRRDPSGLISPGPCEKTLQKCFDVVKNTVYEMCIRNVPDPYPGDCSTRGKCPGSSGDSYASCWGSNYSSAASKCWNVLGSTTVRECRSDVIVANCE
jgi:RHS repeat-associated protein